MRKITGRAIISIIKDDIQAAAGIVQLCASQEAGCEAAVHAMKQVFESPDADAIILVDATNAFNRLNHENALRNIQHLYLPIAKALNTYRNDAQLFIDGEMLISQEGTMQGDPLTMAMYGIAVIPLIHRLTNEQVQKVWFADDATVGAQLTPLRDWWDQLQLIGPDFGYLPNASKTWLIVKEDKFQAATAMFQGTGINITTQGKRHLGAALGTRMFVEEYGHSKVAGWIHTTMSLLCNHTAAILLHRYPWQRIKGKWNLARNLFLARCCSVFKDREHTFILQYTLGYVSLTVGIRYPLVLFQFGSIR